MSGRKRWLVYDPVWELPLKHQRYEEAMGAPGETVLDVVLEAGDTLYLPRGWMHEALTSDEDSLHLTVGVNVARGPTPCAAVARAEDDVAFRRGVPDDGTGVTTCSTGSRPSSSPSASRRRGGAHSSTGGGRS